jgi:ketosteroid isomerase-like protein
VTPSALELISEAMDALMRADAARLGRLAEEAREVRMPGTEPEQQKVQGKLRVLAHFLALTRRNLRLLALNCGDPSGYGAGRR